MKIQLVLILMVLSFISFSQKMVAVAISNNETKVGDFFSITCTLQGQDVFPEAKDSFAYYPARCISSDSAKHDTPFKGLEILSFRDTSYLSNKENISQRIYSVVAWDSCELSLDGFEYAQENKILISEKAYLKVSFYEPQEGLEMYDIQESFSSWNNDDVTWPSFYWLLLIIGLVIPVFIIWFIRFFKSRKKNEAVKPLEDIILLEIGKLYLEKLWLNDRMQEHFVRFSFLLRSYLTERYEVSFLDKTTDQSKLILKKIDMTESIRMKVIELLLDSDFVKFADSSISNERILLLKRSLEEIVRDTTPNPEAKYV